MSTNSQYLNGQFSEAQIEQLIQSLRGMKPIENDILDEEKSVNKENMASYAEIVKDDGKGNEYTNTNTKSNASSEKVKPVFLKDEDVFGSSMKPARSLWLTIVEISDLILRKSENRQAEVLNVQSNLYMRSPLLSSHLH